MKINYLYEAGVFGSYKKDTKQANISNVKKDLAREAKKHILDKLAELYLDMLNEVNSQTTKISRKYHNALSEEQSNLVELTNYMVGKLVNFGYKMPVKEMQLNLIKNMYCNKHTIEFMTSHGCFIIPLVDAEHLSQNFFNDAKEIPSYKNMTKTVAAAIENVIKSHLSEFPDFITIPNTVKIIILQDSSLIKKYESLQEQQLLSYMGVTNSGVEFEYPGKGSDCLDYIINTCSLLTAHFPINLTKSYEHIFKEMLNPSPWMFNKFVLSSSFFTKMSSLIDDNFYGIKLLKFALDNDITSERISYSNSIIIIIDNVLKNIKYMNKFKQEISNNGLDNFVVYNFYDSSSDVDSLVNIGKELTAEQAEQEGIDIDILGRKIYEFDYNNAAEVKSAAKKIIGGCFKFLTDEKSKKIAEAKIEKYLPSLMSKVLASRPNCASSSNKALLCQYINIPGNENIRVVIHSCTIKINKKGNLEFYIAIEFDLPVRGASSKYNIDSRRKKYEFITDKKIKIEIPL